MVRPMRVMRQILLPLAALVLGHASAAEPEISGVSWLSGCWAAEGGEPGSGEQWTSVAGNTMLGMSRTVKDGKTAQFEFMELRYLADGRLAFIAHPSGQRTTTFPVLSISDSEAVFENLQHDFPQRVAYAREGEDRLKARIEGMRKGALRVIEFPMGRVACDGVSRDL